MLLLRADVRNNYCRSKLISPSLLAAVVVT